MNITAMGQKSYRRRGADALRDRNALELALDLYRNPGMMALVRKSPLPNGMSNIIRVAGSTDEEIAQLIEAHDTKPSELRAAAAFFIQQVLFQAGRDNLRMLGLKPGASQQEIKDHKRLLLKWLHPDRNRNSWESAYFQRVTSAANNVEAGSVPSAIEASPPVRHRKKIRSSKASPVTSRLQKKAFDWGRFSAWALRRAALVAAFAILILAAMAVAHRLDVFENETTPLRGLLSLME